MWDNVGFTCRLYSHRQPQHLTTEVSTDIWCSIGSRSKLDYGKANGSDSFSDRFTKLHWIAFSQKGCKTCHLLGELHTVWNYLFLLGNPHNNVFWFMHWFDLPFLRSHNSSELTLKVCSAMAPNLSHLFISLLKCCMELSLAFDRLDAYNTIILHHSINCTSQDLQECNIFLLARKIQSKSEQQGLQHLSIPEQ